MRSIVYNDKQSLFSELLEKDGSISIHMRNIQSVAIENFVSAEIYRHPS